MTWGPRRRVGHGAVGRGTSHHVGMPGDDGLDRRRREALAVDPEPIGRAAGEVDPSVLVHVRQVPAPVPPLAGRLLHRLVVAVVALEGTNAKGVDELADAAVGVEEAAVGVELCPGRLSASLVGDHDPLPQSTDGAAGAVAGAVERDGTFGRSEHVDDPHPESGRRLLDHLG